MRRSAPPPREPRKAAGGADAAGRISASACTRSSLAQNNVRLGRRGCVPQPPTLTAWSVAVTAAAGIHNAWAAEPPAKAATQRCHDQPQRLPRRRHTQHVRPPPGGGRARGRPARRGGVRKETENRGVAAAGGGETGRHSTVHEKPSAKAAQAAHEAPQSGGRHRRNGAVGVTASAVVGAVAATPPPPARPAQRQQTAAVAARPPPPSTPTARAAPTPSGAGARWRARRPWQATSSLADARVAAPGGGGGPPPPGGPGPGGGGAPRGGGGGGPRRTVGYRTTVVDGHRRGQRAGGGEQSHNGGGGGGGGRLAGRPAPPDRVPGAAPGWSGRRPNGASHRGANGGDTPRRARVAALSGAGATRGAGHRGSGRPRGGGAETRAAAAVVTRGTAWTVQPRRLHRPSGRARRSCGMGSPDAPCSRRHEPNPSQPRTTVSNPGNPCFDGRVPRGNLGCSGIPTRLTSRRPPPCPSCGRQATCLVDIRRCTAAAGALSSRTLEPPPPRRMGQYRPTRTHASGCGAPPFAPLDTPRPQPTRNK